MEKVWVTKYALSSGVYEVEGEARSSGIFSVAGGGYLSSSDFRLTKEDAVNKADDMRRRKIINLKRQIEKLESADFKKTDPYSRGNP